jgi:26S proteasome regulatory subunit N2
MENGKESEKSKESEKEKDESTTEKSEKEKSEKGEVEKSEKTEASNEKPEPEPDFQLLENPARSLTSQVKRTTSTCVYSSLATKLANSRTHFLFVTEVTHLLLF